MRTPVIRYLARFAHRRTTGSRLRLLLKLKSMSPWSVLLGTAFAAQAAYADCSRPIVVPLSPTGTAVIVSKDQFGGAYVDVLRDAGAKEGCRFEFSGVPRARQELMFREGQADLLVPAVRAPARDEVGQFVPLTSVRAQLISVDPTHAPVHSMKELEGRRELKLALLRGYDYGDAYQALIAELKKQGRLSLEPDPVSIARLMQSGGADATIMTAPIFSGAVQMDARFKGLQAKLRYESLEDLPWTDSGAYVSKTSLNAEDRTALLALLEHVAKSGALWASIKNYEQTESLKDSVRPQGNPKLGTK